jgi:hypothetical protein
MPHQVALSVGVDVGASGHPPLAFFQIAERTPEETLLVRGG